jgi:hypothetical protein
VSRRYLSFFLDGEYVHRWEIGLELLVVTVRRQMMLHHLADWPELVHAEQINEWQWKLVFAWPEQPDYIDSRTEGCPSW